MQEAASMTRSRITPSADRLAEWQAVDTALRQRQIVYGIATREQRQVRSGKLMKTSRAVVGFWFNHCLDRPEMVEAALSDLFARAARGELRAVVGATYPLSEAARAQTDLAERRTTGKLLLAVR